MSDLIKEVTKLDVEEGDTIVIQPAEVSDDIINAVRSLAAEVSTTLHCLVIILGPDDRISSLDDEMMAANGWVRKDAE